MSSRSKSSTPKDPRDRDVHRLERAAFDARAEGVPHQQSRVRLAGDHVERRDQRVGRLFEEPRHPGDVCLAFETPRTDAPVIVVDEAFGHRGADAIEVVVADRVHEFKPRSASRLVRIARVMAVHQIRAGRAAIGGIEHDRRDELSECIPIGCDHVVAKLLAGTRRRIRRDAHRIGSCWCRDLRESRAEFGVGVALVVGVEDHEHATPALGIDLDEPEELALRAADAASLAIEGLEHVE
jgi:hypothetical protein